LSCPRNKKKLISVKLERQIMRDKLTTGDKDREYDDEYDDDNDDTDTDTVKIWLFENYFE
jgi:hypothetical protein